MSAAFGPQPRHSFEFIWQAIQARPDLTMAEKAVACGLALHQDRDGVFHHGIGYLAGVARTSDRTVRRALRRLIRVELLQLGPKTQAGRIFFTLGLLSPDGTRSRASWTTATKTPSRESANRPPLAAPPRVRARDGGFSPFSDVGEGEEGSAADSRIAPAAAPSAPTTPPATAIQDWVPDPAIVGRARREYPWMDLAALQAEMAVRYRGHRKEPGQWDKLLIQWVKHEAKGARPAASGSGAPGGAPAPSPPAADPAVEVWLRKWRASEGKPVAERARVASLVKTGSEAAWRQIEAEARPVQEQAWEEERRRESAPRDSGLSGGVWGLTPTAPSPVPENPPSATPARVSGRSGRGISPEQLARMRRGER